MGKSLVTFKDVGTANNAASVVEAMTFFERGYLAKKSH
jgi:hypothetical protein